MPLIKISKLKKIPKRRKAKQTDVIFPYCSRNMMLDDVKSAGTALLVNKVKETK